MNNTSSFLSQAETRLSDSGMFHPGCRLSGTADGRPNLQPTLRTNNLKIYIKINNHLSLTYFRTKITSDYVCGGRSLCSGSKCEWRFIASVVVSVESLLYEYRLGSV